MVSIFCLFGMISLAQGSDPSPSVPAKATEASPFAGEILRSKFKEVDLYTERDPLAPVGYFKPKPPPPGAPAATETAKPLVELRLVISGISSMGDTRIATLEDGSLLEENGIFKFSDGKNTVTYKVLRIFDDRITILYEDKEMVFKMKAFDLDIFKEKE